MTTEDRIRRILYGRSTQLVKHAVTGKMVSSKSKTGLPACSSAVSAWRTGGASAETYKTLAMCRAAAKTAATSHLAQAAGHSAKAAHLDSILKSGAPVGPKARNAAAEKLRTDRGQQAPPAPSVEPPAPPPKLPKLSDYVPKPVSPAQRAAADAFAAHQKAKDAAENPRDSGAKFGTEQEQGLWDVAKAKHADRLATARAAASPESKSPASRSSRSIAWMSEEQAAGRIPPGGAVAHSEADIAIAKHAHASGPDAHTGRRRTHATMPPRSSTTWTRRRNQARRGRPVVLSEPHITAVRPLRRRVRQRKRTRASRHPNWWIRHRHRRGAKRTR